MDGNALLELADARARELPGATLCNPFGPEWEVYKVRGRIFLLMTALAGEPIVTVKASPADGEALRQTYPEITPGYHMDKRHWVTLAPGPALDAALVQDLVAESYLLVVAKLPRAARPVDPDTFGRGGPHAEVDPTS